MSLTRYNNPNLLKFQKPLVLNNKLGVELASGTLQASGVLDASAASGVLGVSGASGSRTFNINSIKERLNNKDLTVLQELDAIPVNYTFTERADGYDFECTYNGQHYEIHYTDPNANVDNGSYSLDDLKNTYKFSDQDISTFFEKQNDKYVIRKNAVKNCFGREDITTVSQLLDAMKNDGFSEGYVRGAYNFSQEQADKYLTLINQNPKKYVINQNAVKADFPDKEIITLGQLNEAINNSTDKFDDDLNAPTYAEGILRGALGLSAAIVSEYFRKQSDGTYKLDQSVVKKRFPNDTITTAEELRDAIRAHKTVFTSKGELMGRFGLSAFMVENFFKENADGTYSYDLEKMKYFFKDDKIPYTIETLKNTDLYTAFTAQFWSNQTEWWSEDDDRNEINGSRRLLRYVGADFDVNLAGDEVLEYMNVFKSILKERYKGMSGYDDEFLEKAFNAVFEECNIQSNKTYYLDDVMSAFEGYCGNLVRGGWGEWFDGLTPEMPTYYKSGNYKTDRNGNIICERKTYSSYGLTSQEMSNWIKSHVNSEDMAERFQANMLMEKFNELGLNYDEIDAFMDVLWRELAEKLGVTNTDKDTGNVRINLYDMAKLDTNNDNSVLYELYQIINEKAEDIKHISLDEIKYAETVDINELFKSSNNLNAEYIEEHLSEMLLSNDPGVRKLATMINDYCKQILNFPGGNTAKIDAYTKTEKQERIMWLIVLLNEQCGVQNPNGNPSTTNVGLTPELLNKLGDNVFDKVDEVINSQKLETCLKANINGVIEDFYQGCGTGDCWLLSGISAVNSTPAGKELLKNAIKWNSDYTAITVTFPGTGQSTVITIDELLTSDPDLGGTDISNRGDNDVLAIVLAYRKLYGEIDSDYADAFLEKFIKGHHHYEHASGIDDLFSTIGSLFGGGGRADIDEDNVLDYLGSMYNAMKNGENVAATFSLITSGDTTYHWTTTDGEKGSINLDHGGMFDMLGGHVFAITDITETTVTFVNPWDSTISYTVTWNEFAGIGIGEMAWSTW